MKLTKTQRLILYALGRFYESINQPLVEKPVQLRTSKIAFIELLRETGIISTQERALYRNLESLEELGLIGYEQRMIRFTVKGLVILNRINKEIEQFVRLRDYFLQVRKPHRKLQTVMR